MNKLFEEQVPSLKDQADWWDSWNLKHRTGTLEVLDEATIRRGTKVLEFCTLLPPAQRTICEIGCGTGWLCERLVEFGSVTGVDLSSRAIESARLRLPGAAFVAGDFFDVSLPAASFDIVICLETISYVNDQSQFFSKLASLVKPNGYVIITSVNKFVFDRRDDVKPPGPGQIRKWLSKQEIFNLFKTDFKIISVDTVLPCGNRGILRVTNSYKINKILEAFFPPARIEAFKESLGLGQSIVIVAQKNPSPGNSIHT